MEKYRVSTFFKLSAAALLLTSCASILEISERDKKEIVQNEEFEQAVKIEVTEPPAPQIVSASSPATIHSPEPKAPSQAEKKTAARRESVPEKPAVVSPKEKSKKKDEQLEKAPLAKTTLREPELEDSEGFVGRRPAIDPYRVGEVLTHRVHYFKVSAGELKLKVEPFAMVNGRKSYTFATEIRSSPVFSSFYSVDDRAVTYVDFEDLVPRTYSLSVKETGQIREARSLFDWQKSQATFWEKKITKKDGEKIKKYTWDILPYSQNVFSAVFYMRNFKWEVGKEIAFRVAHDEENLVFKGKAIRRERIETEVGAFNAIVIKPEITVKGAFKPMGDIYIWLSDDDRRYVLRLESKIKIGTLVAEIINIQPGAQ